MTRWKALIAIFCRVHFVFSFQLLFSSTFTFRLQGWSPRGHLLKSLASKLQVLKHCPNLGSRTAVFWNPKNFVDRFSWKKIFFVKDFFSLSFWDHLKKNFEDLFFLNARKKYLKTDVLLFYFIFGEHLRLCPCPRKGLSSKGLSLASDVFCVIGLEPCALDYTAVLCPFKPNFKRPSPLSHINFYINFIQSIPGNTLDGAWCVACRYRLSSRIVKRFDCTNNA